MARADRRRAQRAKPVAVRRSDVVVEDTMFFPRLRRHAKWMFLFLALAFGLGFVGFGVGAGGIGVGDIFRGTGGSSGIPSASDARERIAENPKDAQAFRDLATALQADGETDEAIQALESYASLRPKDVDALRQLAILYQSKVEEAARRYQIAQLRTAYLATGATVADAITLGGRGLDLDPISDAVSSVIATDSSAALGDVQASGSKLVDAYRSIADATPDDPNAQILLADAATSVGDIATAIAAYEKYLASPLVSADEKRQVRSLLKQLKSQSGTSG
jgi:tetratricopeptide (TPR) repeat protein